MTATLRQSDSRIAESAVHTNAEVDAMVDTLVRVIPADALLCKQEQSAWRHSVTAKRFEPLRESTPLLATIAGGLHDAGYRRPAPSIRDLSAPAHDELPFVPRDSAHGEGQVLDTGFLRHMIANVTFQARGARIWGPEIAAEVVRHLEAAARALEDQNVGEQPVR
ncbi:hypothetical protein [Humidisolicoccus flavus]|uniref:hypothetical protein n=1 Tax=Humidisolicoccus flavus TaxID=3111414 RepID=UPI00324B3955